MSRTHTLHQIRRRLAAVLFASLLLIIALLVPQRGSAASEARDCTAEPTTNMPIGYGNVLSGGNCYITPVADLDSFAFSAAANDTIRILGLKIGGGYYASPCFDLRDPDGLQVGTPVCAAAIQIDQTLTKAGIYRIIVTEDGNNDIVQYNLSLTRMYPFQAGAVGIKYGQVLSDEINPQTDLDWFVFSGTMGDQIRLNAVKTGGGYYASVCFEVYQPDTTLLATKTCGVNPLLDATLTQTGTYRILVSEDGNNDVVTYNLGAQCLSGPCKVAQSCTLTDTATYDAGTGTLTMNFLVGNTFAATWNAWLTYGNAMELLFSQAQPVTDPPATVTKTRAALPRSGKVGVLSTLTVPRAGITCSSWVQVNTGTPTTTLLEETVAEVKEPDNH